MRFLKLAYYKEYFQVTEKDVLGRIKSAIVPPFNEEFIDNVRSNPDLYGPFWALTTLVFLLGTVGNFSNYLLSKFSDGDVWNGYFFHLELVRYAVVAIYTFGAGVPLTLYFLLKFLSFDKITFPEVVLFRFSWPACTATPFSASSRPPSSASSRSTCCSGPSSCTPS
jgi:hypothetical protein